MINRLPVLIQYIISHIGRYLYEVYIINNIVVIDDSISLEKMSNYMHRSLVLFINHCRYLINDVKFVFCIENVNRLISNIVPIVIIIVIYVSCSFSAIY